MTPLTYLHAEPVVVYVCVCVCMQNNWPSTYDERGATTHEWGSSAGPTRTAKCNAVGRSPEEACTMTARSGSVRKNARCALRKSFA